LKLEEGGWKVLVVGFSGCVGGLAGDVIGGWDGWSCWVVSIADGTLLFSSVLGHLGICWGGSCEGIYRERAGRGGGLKGPLACETRRSFPPLSRGRKRLG
jgi:hypothetical protein